MSYGAALRVAERPDPDPYRVLELWHSGMDTNDIARQMTCSEPEVYNILALMRGQVG